MRRVRQALSYAAYGGLTGDQGKGVRVLLTNHVLSGALIGALARRPLPAFAAGVASHFLLDAVPHWGKWGSRRRFPRAAVSDGLISLAAMGAIAALSPADRRPAIVAGMSGAALPDIDKPTSLWFGWSPFPKAVGRFHGRIQREAKGRAHVELLAAAGFALAARDPPIPAPADPRLIAVAGSAGRPGTPGRRA